MITVYTTEGCPRCKVLKLKLAQKNIPYEEFTDVDKMIEMGIVNCPMMSVDGGELMTFNEAIQYVNER